MTHQLLSVEFLDTACGLNTQEPGVRFTLASTVDCPKCLAAMSSGPLFAPKPTTPHPLRGVS